MAKKSAVAKNAQRRKLVAKTAARREALKEIANNRELPAEERFAARLKLAQMPRNGNPTRIRNRCELSGRPRGFYRKFKLSRIALRDLGSQGKIAGLTKSSW